MTSGAFSATFGRTARTGSRRVSYNQHNAGMIDLHAHAHTTLEDQ